MHSIRWMLLRHFFCCQFPGTRWTRVWDTRWVAWERYVSKTQYAFCCPIGWCEHTEGRTLEVPTLLSRVILQNSHVFIDRVCMDKLRSICWLVRRFFPFLQSPLCSLCVWFISISLQDWVRKNNIYMRNYRLRLRTRGFGEPRWPVGRICQRSMTGHLFCHTVGEKSWDRPVVRFSRSMRSIYLFTGDVKIRDQLWAADWYSRLANGMHQGRPHILKLMIPNFDAVFLNSVSKWCKALCSTLEKAAISGTFPASYRYTMMMLVSYRLELRCSWSFISCSTRQDDWMQST